MKILLISDLHLEFGNPIVLPKDGYDVVVLAGDISVPAAKVVQWALRPSTFPCARAIVFVAGNHESYGQVLDKTQRDVTRRAEGTKFYALDCAEAIIGEVRFLGATLWADFQCRIDGSEGPRSNAKRAMDVARHSVADFRAIRRLVHDPHMSRGKDVPAGVWYTRLLTPEDSVAIHNLHRDWLASKLREPFSGATVVVTHHAPHRGSLAARYAADWASGAFVSELPGEFFRCPSAMVPWAHAR